ncbi:hypothetical protein [Myroides sp. WP-1]|uniref:hypothetical protein n=1 Tax=Myroides sp. WP-1 TaxID=2759944 RepID=UPI0015FCE165|nr:hypothetical protein [Myroides sp. WP-1]MBB1139459.1 hypothetical protein [Myroides sp. WP-1]
MNIINKFWACILVSVIFLSSCSSDDESSYDPIFSAKYIPLTDLTQLEKSTYFYAGIKIEGYKTSLLPPDGTSCVKDDILVPTFDNENNFERLEYIRTNKRCSEGFGSIILVKNKLIENGILRTNMYFNGNFYYDKNGVRQYYDSDENWEFRGNLEIGFQGDYLRIEDRMSHYSRPGSIEKVYLYFKAKR